MEGFYQFPIKVLVSVVGEKGSEEEKVLIFKTPLDVPTGQHFKILEENVKVQ